MFWGGGGRWGGGHFLQVSNGVTRITHNCHVSEEVIWKRATLSLIDKR